MNNLKVEEGVLFDTRNICEFCGIDHKDNCEFTFNNSNTTWDEFKNRVNTTLRPSFSLVVLWKNSKSIVNIQLLEKPEVLKFDTTSK